MYHYEKYYMEFQQSIFLDDYVKQVGGRLLSACSAMLFVETYIFRYEYEGIASLSFLIVSTALIPAMGEAIDWLY